MIDIKLVREHPETVRASQRARGEDEGIVDAILAADERRRSSLTEFEQLRAQQKSFGKQVAAARGEEKAALVAQAKATSDRVKELQAAADAAEQELATLVRRVGNVIEEGVPVGGEDDYTVLETVGTARDFAEEGFEPRTTSSSARASAPSTWSAAPRSAARGSTSSPASAPGSSSRCSTWRSPRRSRPASPR